MPITFIKLGSYGRFGNALFEASTTIALALRNNDDYVFPHCFLENTTNIPLEKFKHINQIKYTSTYNEPHYHYSPILYKPNLNIHGYYQSWRYFHDFYPQIYDLLHSPVWTADMSEWTSLHVRRTDYLIHKDCYHILTRENYYDKAMELSKGKKFLIFSDDISWCKSVFRGNEFEFAEGNPDHIDMHLQSSCGNNIIANSSFSWWGAYLNQNSNKKIIYPKIWFGPQLAPTHDTKDLIPPGWIGA